MQILPIPHRANVLACCHVLQAVRYSEESRTKCIGLTIETRPDYCARSHLSDMLSYGCTRLEIGLQSIYEDVARDTNRSVRRALGETALIRSS